MRKIIHIDMDAFYASVEQRNNPNLKGKPIIVGGLPSERGVVATASYEARKFGIHSAMATGQALKLCPELIIVKPDFAEYSKISKILISFYKEYTDIIEPLSLDECYLDVTNDKKGIGIATEIANRLRDRIKNELNLTATAGIAPNKLLAKIASEVNKPDGIFVIKPNQIEKFMLDLDVKKLWGVGKVTLKKLNNLGIKTCGDLQKYPEIELVKLFGKFGTALYYFARGIDDSEVCPFHEIKSIASERTFPHDTNDIDYIKKVLLGEIEIVSNRLIKQELNGKTITLKLKYADFNRITRSITINHYADNKEEIFENANKLLSNIDLSVKKIRLIGIAVSNLIDINKIEKNLFN